MGGAITRIYITATTTTTWKVPFNWNNASNTIEVIGGGSGGTCNSGSSGCGGGAYSKAINRTLMPGATVTIAVGAGGNGAGGDTYVCNSTSNCGSLAGTAVIVGAQGGQTSGAGGSSASGVGSTKNSGGSGATSFTSYHAGGGGAAGPNGDGKAGGLGGTSVGGGGGGADNGSAGADGDTSGNGGNGRGGTGGGAGNASGNGANGTVGTGGGGGGAGANANGGNGASDTEFDVSHGSGGGGGGGFNQIGNVGGSGALYGGGGGGGKAAGTGGQGIIVITYQGGTLIKPANNLGLVGYWKFDEASGTLAHDFSGFGNKGTLTTTGSVLPQWVNGKRGMALSFDGSTNFVDAGKTPSESITGAISVSAWIKVPSPALTCGIYGCAIISNADGGGDAQYELEYDGTNINFYAYAFGAGGQDDKSSQTVSTSTSWYHIVATRDAANTATQIYINGSSTPVTRTGSVTIPSAGFRGDTEIGGDNTDGIWYFSGIIDEVRLYNRQLSASDVANLYAQGTAGATQVAASSATLTNGTKLGPNNGLVGHWTFDGPDFTDKVYDRSGQNNNGYVVGSATSSAKGQGHLGQGLQLDGSTNYVDVGQSSSLSLTSDMSISAWVNFNATGQDGGAILTNYNSVAGDTQYGLFVNNSIHAFTEHAPIFEESTSANNFSALDWVAPIGSVIPGVWYHIVATRQGMTTVHIYINGVDQTLNTYGSGSSIVATQADTTIGSKAQTPTFGGTIDDVRIYNRALTAKEVMQLYKVGSATIGSK